MTHQERILNRIEGKTVDRVPWFPDLSKWYSFNRTEGEPVNDPYDCGEFIPDDSPIHKLKGTIPEKYQNMTLLDIIREFDCGLPIHNYKDWFDVEYSGLEYKMEESEEQLVESYITPLGTINSLSVKSMPERSWARKEYFLKGVKDFKIMEYVLSHRKIIPRYDRAQKIIDGIGESGISDLVTGYSPLAELVIELMGIEKTYYNLADNKKETERFMDFLKEQQLEKVRVSANSPVKVIILGDNMDEFLISPPFYKKYCLPFYQQACEILHRHNKKVSSHMDGNLKNLLPMVKDTGFDILDGCTPSPMTNYEIEDLRNALGERMVAYCGIPSSLFVQETENNTILNFAKRIINIMGDHLILNIGDILPVNGDIEQVRFISAFIIKDST